MIDKTIIELSNKLEKIYINRKEKFCFSKRINSRIFNSFKKLKRNYKINRIDDTKKTGRWTFKETSFIKALNGIIELSNKLKENVKLDENLVNKKIVDIKADLELTKVFSFNL